MNAANIIQAARGNTSYSFGRTWPALIIIFGVLKLLERMAGPPEPPYTPSVPPGFQPPPGGYQQGPGSYPGSVYEPGPGYQAPPQNPGGNPQ